MKLAKRTRHGIIILLAAVSLKIIQTNPQIAHLLSFGNQLESENLNLMINAALAGALVALTYRLLAGTFYIDNNRKIDNRTNKP